MTKPIIIWDCEIYHDYLLFMFKHTGNGQVKYFEQFEGQPLDVDAIRKIISSCTLVGFNSINFDTPILTYALKGATNAQLKACCDFIIGEGRKPWHCESKYNFKISSKIDQIDLFEVAPGKGSLKAYGGKLHSKKLQDLPIDPSSSITPEFRPFMREYCQNDLDTTHDLYTQLKPQIALREEMSKRYGIDLRSKSDAQMAEAVIKHELEKLTKKKIEKPTRTPPDFYYKPPIFLSFKTEQLQKLFHTICNTMFIVTDGGKVLTPKEISEAKIQIGNSTYTIGTGGLHSNESCVSYKAEEGMILADYDVASYYPSIIISNGLYPEQLGKPFLTIYKSIRDRRIAAKASGDKTTAECLKTVTNGSFGKFGSKWSILYSPNLLIQVTITGQLSLLMLIEMLELEGVSVVSANTDGILVHTHESNRRTIDNTIALWEVLTGFEMEESRYKAIYMRDVNNYIVIKDKGYKLKGRYAPPVPVATSWPNPHNEICIDAILAFLQHGIDIGKTILECKDIRKFITTQQVTGGAIKDDLYLGRVARWYYSYLGFGYIEYKLNGNRVPKSEGAMPCMVLPDEIPDDLDRQWYVDEAYKILEEIGYV